MTEGNTPNNYVDCYDQMRKKGKELAVVHRITLEWNRVIISLQQAQELYKLITEPECNEEFMQMWIADARLRLGEHQAEEIELRHTIADLKLLLRRMEQEAGINE